MVVFFSLRKLNIQLVQVQFSSFNHKLELAVFTYVVQEYCVSFKQNDVLRQYFISCTFNSNYARQCPLFIIMKYKFMDCFELLRVRKDGNFPKANQYVCDPFSAFVVLSLPHN